MPFEGIEVEGLRELNGALKELSGDLKTELSAGLTSAVQRTRAVTEDLALHKISGMKRARTVRWESMRVGTTASYVYIAPTQRGTRQGNKRRPNLTNLIFKKAMYPAFHQTEDEVTAGAQRVLDNVVRKAGLV